MNNDSGGYVYFALIRDLVKIGHTRGSVEDRLRSVKAEYRAPVRFLGAMPGSREDERALHKRFDHLRELDLFPGEKTEVFRLTRELLDFITGTPIHALETDDFGCVARTGASAGSSDMLHRLRAYDPAEWVRLIRSAMQRAGNRLADAAALLGTSGRILREWIAQDDRLEDLRCVTESPPPFRAAILRLIGDPSTPPRSQGINRKEMVTSVLRDIVAALESVDQDLPHDGSGFADPKRS